jgi:hypothetical protein
MSDKRAVAPSDKKCRPVLMTHRPPRERRAAFSPSPPPASWSAWRTAAAPWRTCAAPVHVSRRRSAHATISLKSSQSAIVAQVRSSSISARGKATRQDCRPSSICEKCLRRTARRDLGSSSSRIVSMCAFACESVHRESCFYRQDKNHPPGAVNLSSQPWRRPVDLLTADLGSCQLESVTLIVCKSGQGGNDAQRNRQ